MQSLKSFIFSPRVKSIIFHAICIGLIAGLNDLANVINLFNLSPFAVTFIGLVLKQVIGGINALAQGQVTGFVK